MRIREGAFAGVPIVLTFLVLLLLIVAPLVELLVRALHDNNGSFIGTANFVHWFSTPALAQTLINSLWVSAVAAFFSCGAGFLYAYGLTRTALPGKAIFRVIAIAPLFAPSMMHAISMIYLFGNKGLVTTGFFGLTKGIDIGLYGPVGIILSECFYLFPKAVLVITVALSVADMRLYEIGRIHGASRFRMFTQVTFPAIRAALVGAFLVTFSLAFTDFGAPKVVGGSFRVLAVDVYRKVIGQQDFSMGATVGLILLLTAGVAFLLERLSAGRQNGGAGQTAPFVISPRLLRDVAFLFVNGICALAICVMLGTVLFASLVRRWPYDCTLTFANFDFGASGGGVTPWLVSLVIAACTAIIGTVVIFVTAWFNEKHTVLPGFRGASGRLALFPMALPGLVIGLSWVLFLNRPTWEFFNVSCVNPFSIFYGTAAALIAANIVHYMPVPYLAAVTALRRLDGAFEGAARSLGVSLHHVLFRVTLPLTVPAIVEMAVYLFVNAMTTVSAVIFLYSPLIRPASVAVVDMEDAGDTAAAAALSVLIVLSGFVVRIAAFAVPTHRQRSSNKPLIEEPL